MRVPPATRCVASGRSEVGESQYTWHDFGNSRHNKRRLEVDLNQAPSLRVRSPAKALSGDRNQQPGTIHE